MNHVFIAPTHCNPIIKSTKRDGLCRRGRCSIVTGKKQRTAGHRQGLPCPDARHVDVDRPRIAVVDHQRVDRATCEACQIRSQRFTRVVGRSCRGVGRILRPKIQRTEP